MKRWPQSFALVFVVLAGCDWGAKPGSPQDGADALIVHVGLATEGIAPEALSDDARFIAIDLLRERKAQRVTTISTFDKSDIYVQFGLQESLDDARADLKRIIAQQSWLAGTSVSEVMALPAAGMPHGIGVVRMQTISILIDPNVLAAFPEHGLEVDKVAATVREIYPGGPATPEMLQQLKELMLKTSDGGSVRFSSIATVEMREVEDPIVRTYP